MAVTRVADGTVSGTAPGLPAGIVSGDLLLCMSSNSTNTPPTMGLGWTSVYFSTDSNGVADHCSGRVYSWVYDGVNSPDTTLTNAQVGVIAAYRGVDPANPIPLTGSPTGAGGATTTITYVTRTMTAPNQMVIWVWHINKVGTNGAISGTDPVPTEELDTTAGTAAVGYADGFRLTMETTGARTSTYSLAGRNLGGTIALKEGPPTYSNGFQRIAPQQRYS